MALSLYICNPALKADLMDLPLDLLDATFNYLMEAAQLIVGLAQIRVRVDTGSLRDSIRVERGGEGQYWKRVRVRAGGYIVNPDTGKLVDYAGHVEKKYPYLRPSILEVLPQMRDGIRYAGGQVLQNLRSTQPMC